MKGKKHNPIFLKELGREQGQLKLLLPEEQAP